MALILTKKSDTSSSVPLAADLTNAAGGAELAVNTADKRLFTKTSGGTVVELGTNPSSMTLPNGTANGVPYLNASKVLTSGTDLVFTATGLGIGTSSPGYKLDISSTSSIGARIQTNQSGAYLSFLDNGGVNGYVRVGSVNNSLVMMSGNNVNATLDSSGNLGLGGTPSAKLHIAGSTLRQNDATNSYGYAVTTSSAKTVTAALFGGGYYTWQVNNSGSDAMTLDASGNLLVGTTSAGTDKVRVSAPQTSYNNIGLVSTDDVNGGGYIAFRNSAITEIGAIKRNGSAAISYNTSSDYRLKENIKPMVGALAKVAALKPVTYTWKADGSAGEGFIAHELAEVCPFAVTGEKDAMRTEQYEISPAIPATFDEEGNELTPAVEAVMGERQVPAYQGIDVSFLVGTLTAAIQELKAEFDAYKAAHP